MIYRFSGVGLTATKPSRYFCRMTDGQVVKLDNGSVAQVKRLAVNGAAYATLLVAVELPPEPRREPAQAH